MPGISAAANNHLDQLYRLICDGLAMGEPAASLTACEWCVLLRVPRDVFPGEIAKTTRLSQPHVSRTLRKLERRGFVVRSLAPGDNRRTMIHVTKEGFNRIRQVHHLACSYGSAAPEGATYDNTISRK
ncbi:MAG: MarR family transcriptional regulator [Acetobacter aceti]